MNRHLSRAALLALPIALLAACGQADADQAAAAAAQKSTPDAAAARVEVALMKPSAASVSISVPGEVEGSRDANLSAALGGYVEAVLAASGDEVHQGQVIAQIDGTIHGASFTQAQAQLELAEAEWERVQKLGDLASASQLQSVETQVKIARASAQAAGARYQRAVITAPFSGTLAGVDREVGEVSGPGLTVARLVQLDPVKVVLSVPDRDVVSLAPGMPARITTTSRSGVFEGTVSHISPAADSSTRAFPVEVTVPNPDRQLLPGMIARVDISTSERGDQLIIPQDWLVTRTSDQGVFVIEDGHAAWRTLKLGAILRDQVVIEGGLSAGDRVVITGHRELVDGDSVLISREGTCCRDGRAFFDVAAGG
jgi:RND family efflux transporter MFP subunit